MATPQDIADAIEEIDEIWSTPVARNGRFGNIIKSVQIGEIRGISNTLEFLWPVTAIAGSNGSGKTTILQLCSTAYAKPQGGRNYKIGEWIRTALEEETPAFGERSFVNFSFWNDAPAVAIPYSKERTRWNYPRRGNPIRDVQFFGISTFAPRIERKDRLHVFRSQIEVKGSAPFDQMLLASMTKVLGVPYEAGTMHTVGLQKGEWSDDLPLVKRGEYGYAEPHMGAGEQKVIRLMRALEALPHRSLVLLEEPEITLHTDAQRGLAWYLMSLAKRKGHQIIITTHSAELFEALPEQARVLIARRKNGVEIVPKAPTISAARELATVARTNKDLILVEDIMAKKFLSDLLIQYNKPLLHNTCIVPVGNTHEVFSLVQAFRKEGTRAIGVRDADTGEAAQEGMYSLPGDLPPEALLLDAANVEATEELVNGITAAYEKTNIIAKGQKLSEGAKRLFPALAREVELDVEMLRDRLTITWLRNNREGAKVFSDRLAQALQ